MRARFVERGPCSAFGEDGLTDVAPARARLARFADRLEPDEDVEAQRTSEALRARGCR